MFDFINKFGKQYTSEFESLKILYKKLNLITNLRHSITNKQNAAQSIHHYEFSFSLTYTASFLSLNLSINLSIEWLIYCPGISLCLYSFLCHSFKLINSYTSLSIKSKKNYIQIGTIDFTAFMIIVMESIYWNPTFITILLNKINCQDQYFKLGELAVLICYDIAYYNKSNIIYLRIIYHQIYDHLFREGEWTSYH